MSDKNEPENNPQHHVWKALFRKYTWWTWGGSRMFVIVSRMETLDGDITTISLLEKDKEDPHERPYEEILQLFKNGQLQRTSKLPE